MGDGTESLGTLVEYKAGPKQPAEPVVQGSHTYTEAGSYPITVAILGDATAQNSMAIFTNAVTATISNIALAATGIGFSCSPTSRTTWKLRPLPTPTPMPT